MGIKYLITGATGHLGFNLVTELLKEHKKVRILALPNDTNVQRFPKEVEVFYGNVVNKADVEAFLTEENKYQHIVIHCAAIVTIASHYNENVYNVNVNGVKNMVDGSLAHHVKKFIYVSSVHAIAEKPYGEVITETQLFSAESVKGLYAQTKAEASNYVLEATKRGLDAVIVHPSGIIGPNDYLHGHLTQMVIDYCNGRLTAGVDGGYDFVDVRDVTEGIIKVINKSSAGECYILSNKFFMVKDILNTLSKITGHKEIKTYLPIWFAKLTAPLAETYYKLLKQKPLYTSYSLYTLRSNANFSHEKATKELNYHPRDMYMTLSDTVKFLQQEKVIN